MKGLAIEGLLKGDVSKPCKIVMSQQKKTPQFRLESFDYFFCDEQKLRFNVPS